MRKIYFGVEYSDYEEEYLIYTSYENDGYLTDSYDEEDIERFKNLYEKGIMIELMESVFEVLDDSLSKEDIIVLLNKEPGFEYCELLNHKNEEDEEDETL